jgi:hypothetical protein
MSDPNITVRPYELQDYPYVRRLLEVDGRFDPKIDSEERLIEKVSRDPRSVLVAIEEEQIIGTASLIEDGRMAFIVRWVGSTPEGLTVALRSAEEELASRGYDEASVFVTRPTQGTREFFSDQGYAIDRHVIQMTRELPTLPPQSRR